MLEIRRILRHEMLEKRMQIRARRPVRVLIDNETRARMLKKHCRRPIDHARPTDDPLNFAGDLVSPLPTRLDLESFRVSFHEAIFSQEGAGLGNSLRSVLLRLLR